MLNGWQIIEPHLDHIGTIVEVAINVGGTAKQVPVDELRSHIEPMQFFETEPSWHGHPFPGVENTFWIWSETHTWYLDLNEGFAQVRNIPRNATSYLMALESSPKRGPFSPLPPTV